MELKISDLPPQFEKMIYKESRDREILSKFNGFNIKELASKYSMSESYVRAIIRQKKAV
ncbi:MAG: Mor transcription activator family protein [Bacilli bacterium]